MDVFKLREVTRKDTPLILNFIKELAVYEKMIYEVKATEEMIEDSIFNQNGAEVLIAEENNIPIGFALYFYNYSTFIGKRGLYVEDVYLKPEYRGKGYGKTIFKELAKIALDNDCGKMEWVCLDWNKSSIDFYSKMGAFPMDEWSTYRVTRNGIENIVKADN